MVRSTRINFNIRSNIEYCMDFDLLEKYSQEWNLSKDSQLEQKIIEIICNVNNNFKFPISEDSTISSGRVGFIYKNNKTFPNFFEFLSYITKYPIPIEINNCHFGPGEIVVIKDNKEDALGDLIQSTHKIVDAVKNQIK
jgi:hypothetical protein